MATAMDVKEIRRSFEESPFFQHMGIDIVHFEENEVKIKLQMKEYVLNANGTLHGGVHATMLDYVQGMLLRSVSKTRCATINSSIQYLAPSTRGEIYAEGKILQLGYKTAFMEGVIKDSQGKLLAKGSGTFKLIRDGEDH
ncbi:PaaI family thioesterase [Metabacillus indicus]|uniref:PaaI family thioesterase n=1 Tax=Metabacillus indicus TaxID=246786 RepID=UPI0004934A83|nr:PaaI family thioesterase [Metabacillus indicus]KEZ52556.1 phenylacetic acid degradation protein [Metabacillus indicus LMG 22858]